jgi:uncharacterized membrane protein YccF (DUF307 family)
VKGRPVLGIISGLLFGFFVALLLQQLAIAPFTTLTLIGLPVVGVVLGIVLSAWAPLGRR